MPINIRYISKYRLDDIISKCVTVLWDQNLYYLKTLLYLVYYTGIKNQELYVLKKEYIDLEKKRINLPNRTLYFPDVVQELLKKYLENNTYETNIFDMDNSKCMTQFFKINHLLPKGKKINMDVLRNSYGVMLAKKKVPEEVARVLCGKNIKGHYKVERFYDLVGIKDSYIESMYRRKIR